VILPTWNLTHTPIKSWMIRQATRPFRGMVQARKSTIRTHRLFPSKKRRQWSTTSSPIPPSSSTRSHKWLRPSYMRSMSVLMKSSRSWHCTRASWICPKSTSSRCQICLRRSPPSKKWSPGRRTRSRTPWSIRMPPLRPKLAPKQSRTHRKMPREQPRVARLMLQHPRLMCHLLLLTVPKSRPLQVCLPLSCSRSPPGHPPQA